MATRHESRRRVLASNANTRAIPNSPTVVYSRRVRKHSATNPGMADLLADSKCDVSVIFYLRPQLQWIPSAWKQWGLKTGASRSDFVAQCLDSRTPAFKRDIETWKSTLPAANIHVPFLISGIASRRKSCSGLFQSARPFTERVQVLKAKPEIPVSTSRSCTFCRKSLSFL